MSGRLATPSKLWAVIEVLSRSEWIHYHTLSSTKRGAWRNYIREYMEADRTAHHEMLKNGRVRIAKVVVIEQRWASR